MVLPLALAQDDVYYYFLLLLLYATLPCFNHHWVQTALFAFAPTVLYFALTFPAHNVDTMSPLSRHLWDPGIRSTACRVNVTTACHESMAFTMAISSTRFQYSDPGILSACPNALNVATPTVMITMLTDFLLRRCDAFVEGAALTVNCNPFLLRPTRRITASSMQSNECRGAPMATSCRHVLNLPSFSSLDWSHRHPVLLHPTWLHDADPASIASTVPTTSLLHYCHPVLLRPTVPNIDS